MSCGMGRLVEGGGKWNVISISMGVRPMSYFVKHSWRRRKLSRRLRLIQTIRNVTDKLRTGPDRLNMVKWYTHCCIHTTLDLHFTGRDRH